jgi:hypothetical protein
MLPVWFQGFYKPGKQISSINDWPSKLDEITLRAREWNVGVIVGVPAWVQMLMEKIIAHYQVATIHDIWPNLSIYVHGGVSFEPYKASFEHLVARPLIYMETYLASEGFIAYQDRPGGNLRLVLDNGLFMEFVPFTENNFNQDGELVHHPETLLIDEVEEGKDYALLLSTCAGAWRYLIGDVIRFTDKKESEIIISGRTKHYLSLCGEHLSVDNMNKAVSQVAQELNININEYTVAGYPLKSGFGHRWYLGASAADGGASSTTRPPDAADLVARIDARLKVLNDDYRTEREDGPLKEVQGIVLDVQAFNQFLKAQGKEGGQTKFPRVIKKKQLEQWEAFVRERLG